MYAVAASLDPDRYRRLARAAFAEMALAGFSGIGEFHLMMGTPAISRHHPYDVIELSV